MRKLKLFAVLIGLATVAITFASCGKEDSKNDGNPSGAGAGSDDTPAVEEIDYSVTPTSLEGTIWDVLPAEFVDEGHIEFKTSSQGEYIMLKLKSGSSSDYDTTTGVFTYSYAVVGEKGVGEIVMQIDGNEDGEVGTFTVTASQLVLYPEGAAAPLTFTRRGAPKPTIESKTYMYDVVQRNDWSDPDGGDPYEIREMMYIKFLTATSGTYLYDYYDYEAMFDDTTAAEHREYEFAYTFDGANGTILLLIDDVPHRCPFRIGDLGTKMYYTDFDEKEWVLSLAE